MTSFGSNHSSSGAAVIEESRSVSILNFSLSSPPPALSTTISPLTLCPASITPTPKPATAIAASASAQPKKTALIPCNSGNGQAWLASSSPSHARPFNGMDPYDPLLFDAADLNYRSWIVRHPSALTFFDRIIEAANGKKVAVFLDYDGTLAPIVDNPDHAFMSDRMREAVKAVSGHFPTAIISGRCRQKVYDFVQLPELYYAGSHGMDIKGPASNANATMTKGTRALDDEGNEVVLFELSSDLTSTIEDVCRELTEMTKVVDGARIENNKFCATVHFRCVQEEDWNSLAEMVDGIVQFYPNLCLTQGRKVLEIRPTISWNKGKALQFLLDSLGLGDQDDVFPIYIGDDRTDEDAFKVLNDKGGQGLSILVSTTPKESVALCSLRDPCEVMEFLRRLVNWRVNQMLNIDSHP